MAIFIVKLTFTNSFCGIENINKWCYVHKVF